MDNPVKLLICKSNLGPPNQPPDWSSFFDQNFIKIRLTQTYAILNTPLIISSLQDSEPQ